MITIFFIHYLKFQIIYWYLIMDVAAFSGDNFDPKDWINKALKSSDPTQNKVCWFLLT